MKIVQTIGCICYSLEVDGKPETEMNNVERLKVIKKLYDKIIQHPDKYLNDLLQCILQRFGDFEYLDKEPCECCGDMVEQYTLEI